MDSLHTTRVSLMARIGRHPGDPGVWSEFAAIYAPAVVRWCRRHGLQPADASDVAQEVLIRFWRHAGAFRYDPDRGFRAHLGRMVALTLADWSAARRADRLVTADGTPHGLLDSQPAREDLVARIEKAFDTEILALAMADVEARVKPRTWEAFRMLALEKVPGPVVALRLSMDPRHVYVARSNVQRMIRAAVRKLSPDTATS